MKTDFQRVLLVTTGDCELTVVYEPISQVRNADEPSAAPSQAAMGLLVDACNTGLPN
jgi:hypothetical protein